MRAHEHASAGLDAWQVAAAITGLLAVTLYPLPRPAPASPSPICAPAPS
ncbi:hypothetical protein [Nonomuraea dietziae]